VIGSSDIKSFRDLRVWQVSMDAADLALAACEEGPLSKKYRLAGQLEAAAASIPANIAEGHAGGSTNVYLRHLYIARGSLAETMTFLELFARRKYVTAAMVDGINELLESTGKLLNALIGSLERKVYKGRKPQAQSPMP
jgi:four helix bundle protein